MGFGQNFTVKLLFTVIWQGLRLPRLGEELDRESIACSTTPEVGTDMRDTGEASPGHDLIMPYAGYSALAQAFGFREARRNTGNWELPPRMLFRDYKECVYLRSLQPAL